MLKNLRFLFFGFFLSQFFCFTFFYSFHYSNFSPLVLQNTKTMYFTTDMIPTGYWSYRKKEKELLLVALMCLQYLFLQSLYLSSNNFYLITWLSAIRTGLSNVLMCMIISKYILLWFPSRVPFGKEWGF